jgi:hypothetical protein
MPRFAVFEDKQQIRNLYFDVVKELVHTGRRTLI